MKYKGIEFIRIIRKEISENNNCEHFCPLRNICEITEYNSDTLYNFCYDAENFLSSGLEMKDYENCIHIPIGLFKKYEKESRKFIRPIWKR